MDLQRASKDYTNAIKKFRPALRRVIEAGTLFGIKKGVSGAQSYHHAHGIWSLLEDEIIDAINLICGSHEESPLNFERVLIGGESYIRYSCPKVQPDQSAHHTIAVVPARLPLGPPPGYIEPTDQELLKYLPGSAFPHGRALKLLGKGSPNVPGTVTFTREEVAYLRRCFESHAQSWAYECKFFQRHWQDAYEEFDRANFWKRHAEELQQQLNQYQAALSSYQQPHIAVCSECSGPIELGANQRCEKCELGDELAHATQLLGELQDQINESEMLYEDLAVVTGHMGMQIYKDDPEWYSVGEGEVPTNDEADDEPDDDSTQT